MVDTILNTTVPLAERLRPKSIDAVIGQQHLLGQGKPLRILFEGGHLHSMILWGPPGIGKTTLARLMANTFKFNFIALSAVLSGMKEIRDAVESAQIQLKQGKKTIVFVDEVHRFNKAQQDAFLPYVESGMFIFVGATTENPSFEINSALLSRVSVYLLKGFSDTELSEMLDRACTVLGDLTFTDAAKKILIDSADGDGRKLLNNIESVMQFALIKRVKSIDDIFLASTLTENFRYFDKSGDVFYNQISALQKSVRGSSPDGAMYWLCRMLDGGVDPRYLARRILRMAWEDIGLADPRAASIALDAAETYERLGTPEGELALAQAVLYLAAAPKSNAGYNAYNEARAFVSKDKSRPVPLHLCNVPTRLMKNSSYAKNYRYAHNEPNAYAAGETYFPDDLPLQQWYRPVQRGLENKIGEKLSRLKLLDADWLSAKKVSEIKAENKN
ncbi:replication-associated recombination protein A [Candidatus Pandoraea novymonadis]|nr:replication-associated recombination protein A [Candidatus Pandoraea novymonadis]